MEPRRDLATVMVDVARTLQAENRTPRTLQTVVDLAVTTIDACDHAAVSIVRPGGIHTPAASDDVPQHVDRIQYEVDEGPCLSAIRAETMYITGDLLAEERWPAFATRAVDETGVRSMLSFRLFAQEENLGALNLYSRRTDAFDEDSLTVGYLFAAHAALAISTAYSHARTEERADRSEERADRSEERAARSEERAARSEERAALLQHQADIAVQLQRSMLTELPDLSPFVATARYVPAVEAAEVGGDWYDAVVLPDGDLLLVVGDVVGHDLDAATAMAQARTALRTLAVNFDEPPSDLLTRLDDTLDRLGESRIGTCAAVRLTRRDGRWFAHLATAGHPRPLLLGPGRVRYVDMPYDLLLGVQHPLERRTTEIPLPPGTRLLLFTDGLLERRDRSLGRGLTELRQAAAQLDGVSVDTMCDALLERLAPCPPDDVCLLAVELPADAG